MGERMPPLGALRTFEAAARHLSFTKAADELAVTQAAVSHQIKALEQHLGVALFRRLNRALMLTDEGQALLPPVRDGFATIAAGVRRVRDLCCEGGLSISTTPSFAANWLARRLVRFQAHHPEIEIQLTATARSVDLAREGVDIAIRYGEGDWPGLIATRLFSSSLAPVCSPALSTRDRPLRCPADLAHHTLLHALDDPDDWRLWLRAAGVEGIDPTRGLKFDNVPLALQAAISGAGVAIGRSRFAADDLEAGRLIEPFEVTIPDACAYYLVIPEGAARQPKVEAFRNWLLAALEAPEATSDDVDPRSPRGTPRS